MENQQNAKGDFCGLVLPVSLDMLKLLISEAVTTGLSAEIPPKKADEYLDVKEAARFLRLAVPTIYGLTHKQLIPFKKSGKKLLFHREELNRWRIERNRAGSQERVGTSRIDKIPAIANRGTFCTLNGSGIPLEPPIIKIA